MKICCWCNRSRSPISSDLKSSRARSQRHLLPVKQCSLHPKHLDCVSTDWVSHSSFQIYYEGKINQFYFGSYPGLIVAGTVFLLAQLAVIAIWTFLWQRRRKQRSHDNTAASAYGGSSSTSSVPTPTLPGSRSESMSKLYDHSFASRHGMGRQF